MVQRSKRTRELDDSEDERRRKRAAPSRRTNLSQTSIAAKTPPADYGDQAATNGQDNKGTDAERARSSQVEGEVVTDDEDAELEKSLAAEMEKAAAEEEEEEDEG
ncbi:MAG: hypothetical protein L6R42_011600 [Xanthoria sp. 1 TBL-2021]|nr:MAG: hypothetical protein L6R42_011600 [Xanthoria sp. 1 TBL-2021]